jgi:hypothetical protein
MVPSPWFPCAALFPSVRALLKEQKKLDFGEQRALYDGINDASVTERDVTLGPDLSRRTRSAKETEEWG